MKKGKSRKSLEAVAHAAQGDAASAQEVERRAYELYLRRGHAPGSALDDWLQAERELSTTSEEAISKR